MFSLLDCWRISRTALATSPPSFNLAITESSDPNKCSPRTNRDLLTISLLFLLKWIKVLPNILSGFRRSKWSSAADLADFAASTMFSLLDCWRISRTALATSPPSFNLAITESSDPNKCSPRTNRDLLTISLLFLLKWIKVLPNILSGSRRSKWSSVYLLGTVLTLTLMTSSGFSSTWISSGKNQSTFSLELIYLQQARFPRALAILKFSSCNINWEAHLAAAWLSPISKNLSKTRTAEYSSKNRP